MKLLSRTIYIMVTAILFIFMIGSIVFYNIIKLAADEEMKDELRIQKELIIEELTNEPELISNFSIPGYLTIDVIEAQQYQTDVFRDTFLIDNIDGNYKQFQCLITDIGIDKEHFRLTIYRSRYQSNKLVEKIILISTIILLVFILFIYLLNRYTFKRVWADFFNTLEKLKSYYIYEGKKISFDTSDILEFSMLNETLNQMIEKIHEDYENIREFTGNISHEVQTPLAIISQKTELLLQTSPLNSQQVKLIGDIQQTNSKLARLNRILVLLTRIESKQFTNKEETSIINVIDHHLEHFQSLASSMEITTTYTPVSDITILAEPSLIDILIVNLVKNAIFHNKKGGILEIVTGKNELCISNTGEDRDLSEDRIFERFRKSTSNGDSLGLGLFLVKKICEMYSIQIKYHFERGIHKFSLNF